MRDDPPWEDPRKLLTRFGLRASRSLSQNFLITPSVVEHIARATEVEEGEPIIELGPGPGSLTGALLRRGASVVALELDRNWTALLPQVFEGHSLRVVEGDATSLDLRALVPETLPIRLCGNLPYAVTGQIMRRLVEQVDSLRSATVMVQREVASRWRAEPGNKTYGRATVFASAVFEIKRVMTVSPGAFHPRPKVHSEVVHLVPRAEPRALLDEHFTAVVRAAFSQRRKMLRRSLRELGADRAASALESAGIDGTRRAETLSVEEFHTLARAFASD